MQKAKVEIIADIIAFALIVTSVIAIITFFTGHHILAFRALLSVSIIVALIYLSKVRQSIVPLVHTCIILIILTIVSNVVFIFQTVDYSTISLFFIAIFFSFYFLSIQWATFYTIIQTIVISVILLLKGLNVRWTTLPAQEFNSLEQVSTFLPLLLVLFYFMYRVHQANIKFSDYLKENNENLKKINRELKEANIKAESMNKLKSNFLANMSHEVRTPINGIMGLAELMEIRTDDQEVHEMLSMQKQSSIRLLNTVTNILNFSKVESDHVQLELVDMDIVKSIRESEHILRPIARKKNLSFVVDIRGEKIRCKASGDIISQIINHLAGNAIKFTVKGKITLSVQQKNENVLISIKDTGIGISPEFIPKMFNPFEQESTGIKRTYEGSGLGLSIVKRYIEIIKGTISVESEQGKGTEIMISIPSNNNENA